MLVDHIDEKSFLYWTQMASHLIEQVSGANSTYSARFASSIVRHTYDTDLERLLRGRAVFNAAKEDFTFGMFRSLRNLVQAEVFSTELEQASELLNAGYHTAAAVTAGVVLETTVRQLCDTHGIPNDRRSKLDKMNADLAKAGVYNLLVQKRITHLADLRNKAAHGDGTAYSNEDVKAMIPEVERFVSEHLP